MIKKGGKKGELMVERREKKSMVVRRCDGRKTRKKRMKRGQKKKVSERLRSRLKCQGGESRKEREPC